MTNTFRKLYGRFQDWHFHPRCREWPQAYYVEQRALPPPAELCIDCVNLHNSGNPSPDSQLPT